MQKESSSISCVVIRVLGPSLAWAAWLPDTAGAAQTTTVAWPGLDTGHSGEARTRNFTSCAGSLFNRFRPQTRCKDSLLVRFFEYFNSSPISILDIKLCMTRIRILINPKRCQSSVFKDWRIKILLSFPPTSILDILYFTNDAKSIVIAK